MAGVDQRILEIVIRAKDESAKVLDNASKNAGGVGAGAMLGGAAAAGIAAAAAVAGALNKAADAAAAYGGQVTTIQRLTGASAEESSKWAAILGRYGVEGKAAGLVVKSLSTAIVGHSKALADAGIATQNADGSNRTSTAVLADLSEYYSKATDKTAATALAAGVLGKGFMTLLPVLANGKKGIDDLSASAERNGLILSQDQINASKAYGKAVKDNEDAAKGLEVQLGLTVLPIKTQLMQGLGQMLAWFQAHKGEIAAWFRDTWQKMKPTIDALSAVGTFIGGQFKAAWEGIKKSWTELAPKLAPLLPVLKIIGIVLGVIIVAAIVIVIRVIGWLIEAVAWIIGAFMDWQATCRAITLGIGKFFADLWSAIWGGVTAWWDGFITFWTSTVPGFFASVWERIKSDTSIAIDSVVGFITSLPQRLLDGLSNLASIIAKPVQDAWDVLQRLNPFARHSPSLVDNVLAGVKDIGKAYSGLSGMKVGAPVLGGLSGSFAFAGAGAMSSAVASPNNVNARLLAVLENLERDGVKTNIDGKLVSRSLGSTVTRSGRSGAV